MNHNWYAVITAQVLLDNSLSSTQKLLLALVSNLSNERGYCFASNKYLGDCLNISDVTVSKNISELETFGYLGRVIIRNETKQVEQRILTIIEKPLPLKTTTPPVENHDTPPVEKGKENNKVFNNKDKRDILEGSNLYRKPIIPTKEQVLETFVRIGGSKEQAEAFYNTYEGLGWYYKNSPIRNFTTLATNFKNNWIEPNKKNQPVQADSKISITTR